MRVFSVEMLVKEEGAATVQAALNRLKKETQAVAAEMKATSQSVTGAGRAMATTGAQTEVSGTKAAKAAIGFAAVGQTIARTGSLTADAGTRIVEAGSQIAMMFGTGGLIVGAILAGLTAMIGLFGETEREIANLKKNLDNLTDTGNLQGLQDELDKLVKGTASKAGRDAIAAQATELAKLQQQYGYLAQKLTSEMTPAELEARTRMRELREEIQRKRDLIVDIQQRIVTAADTQKYHTTVVDAATATDRRATEAKKRLTDAAKEYERQLEINAKRAERRQADEAARIGTMQSTVGMTQFGGGLQSGEAARMAAWAAPSVTTATAGEFRAKLDAEMQAISQALATVTVPDLPKEMVKKMRLDQLQDGLATGISQSLENGILSGLEMGLASGNIGEAFRAMGQAIVQSMARAMVNIAVAAIKLGTLMEKIRLFMIKHPALAVASAVAMLALARSLGGGATGGEMSAVGGVGGLTYTTPGASTTLPTQQIIFGGTSATTAAGMTPRQAMNVTIIGPNDPQAQRALQEMMTKANSRGMVG